MTTTQVALIQDGLVGANPQTILNRYLDNEKTDAIAASYNVTRQHLASFLLKHAEEDWKIAQVSKAIARKEMADDQLEGILASMPAPEMLDRNTRELAVARARVCEQVLRSAHWELERVCERIYGRKDQLTVVKDDNFAERLRRARERVVEGISTRIASMPVVDAPG